MIGAQSASSALVPVRGGTWTEAINVDADSLIPSGPATGYKIEGVLYLPLFYGDDQGVIHGGAAREIPTVQNGGISADGKTWTFHMRPHLVSQGSSYAPVLAPSSNRSIGCSYQMTISSIHKGNRLLQDTKFPSHLEDRLSSLNSEKDRRGDHSRTRVN